MVHCAVVIFITIKMMSVELILSFSALFHF